MDRNSTIGLSLIFLLLIGYYFINRPSEAEQARQQKFNDSMAIVEKNRSLEVERITKTAAKISDSLNLAATRDSNMMRSKFGGFAAQINGEEKLITLENKDIKVSLNTKGGKISQVQLKAFKRADSSALLLLSKENHHFLEFESPQNNIKTEGFYFETVNRSANEVTMRLNYGPDAYLEHVYKIDNEGYNVHHSIRAHGMNQFVKAGSQVKLHWLAEIPLQEYEQEKERNLTAIYFKNPDQKADYMGETKFEETEADADLEWVSFKQQFFNTTLMPEKPFAKGSRMKSAEPLNADNVEQLGATLILPATTGDQQFNIKFYFGPNKYSALKAQNAGIEKIIPLGWGIFGWINRFMIIPIFNFLSNSMSNYGIIILLLTLIVKSILLPLVYRSYKSTAKMRILKPEIDAIKAKYPDNMQAAQMENLKLYKQAGVNPLGGCLPLLLQMPILIAVFQFVPSAFEFRQQSFLWATDLSHFDSILDFPKYPIIDRIYGSHVSLFTLLMTISTLIYTRMNNEVTGVNEQMKWISYLMPIMFLGFFNSYAAALSYYYFLSNCVTFTQQWAIRKFVDENKLIAQINEAKSKTGPEKKSAFQKRLEEMSKAQNNARQNKK